MLTQALPLLKGTLALLSQFLLVSALAQANLLLYRLQPPSWSQLMCGSAQPFLAQNLGNVTLSANLQANTSSALGTLPQLSKTPSSTMEQMPSPSNATSLRQEAKTLRFSTSRNGKLRYKK